VNPSHIKLKWNVFLEFGGACQACGGDPNCPANGGVATDLHEAFVSRADVSAWPDERKALIYSRLNCVPVCNAVNTGGFPMANWKVIVRRALIAKHGAANIQMWIDSLGMKTSFDALRMAGIENEKK
jgi:hypothetical protein